MYHKNVVRNQIWWLVSPLTVISVSLLMVLISIFYQAGKGRYYKEAMERKEILDERVQDYFEDKKTLFSLLEEGGRALSRQRMGSIQQPEQTLDSILARIHRTRLIGEEVSFLFLLSAEGEILIADKGSGHFAWQDDLFLISYVNPAAFKDFRNEEHEFYLSSDFNYAVRGGLLEKTLMMARPLYDEQTGQFLGSYGIGLSLMGWMNSLQSLSTGSRAIALLNRNLDPLFLTSNLEYTVFDDSGWLARVFNFLNVNSLSTYVEGLDAFYLVDSQLHLSFLSLPVTNFQVPYYLIVGFETLNYWKFVESLMIPLLILSFLTLFLSFLVSYAFLEIFVWKPVSNLTNHIVEISSSSNFFLELPEEEMSSEITYLIMQFRYFQKKWAFLLFEVKNLYMQSSSTQDVVFDKSGRLYFESKEVMDRSLRLESDNQFLNQFLIKFTEQLTLLFETSESMSKALGQSLKRKEGVLKNWRSLPVAEGDNFSDTKMNRLRAWHEDNEGDFEILIRDLSASRSLLAEFNEQRLSLIQCFFEVKQNLVFLMESTQNTIGFLSRVQKEVEELFLIQSQDLRRNRERMQALMKDL